MHTFSNDDERSPPRKTLPPTTWTPPPVIRHDDEHTDSVDGEGVHGTPYYAGYSNWVVGVPAVSVRSSAFTRSWAA